MAKNRQQRDAAGRSRMRSNGRRHDVSGGDRIASPGAVKDRWNIPYVVLVIALGECDDV